MHRISEPHKDIEDHEIQRMFLKILHYFLLQTSLGVIFHVQWRDLKIILFDKAYAFDYGQYYKIMLTKSI